MKYVRSATRATIPIDLAVTLLICAGLGSSTPAASADRFLRSPRFHSPSRISCRVCRSTTAGWRKGRTCSSPSRPSAASAEDDGPLGTRNQRRRDQELRPVGLDVDVGGRHLRISEVAERRRPVGPDHDPRRLEPSVRHPQVVEPDGARQMRFRSSSSISSGSSERSGRPVVSVTSRASFSEAIPAATTGSTGTPPRSASRVTKASCSTCSRRPRPTCDVRRGTRAKTTWRRAAGRPGRRGRRSSPTTTGRRTPTR